ncbi:MAG: NAD(+) synthase [Synergistaceae bacterium]|jgi:NAD+ synthase (glutamine-hydrolysing)|nr:NAD(+) synthase [Synergistaceae bacterium]
MTCAFEECDEGYKGYKGFEGYVRVAAATPTIQVADCVYNAERILALMERANEEQVRLLCLPELCLTGYTCGDLFLQETLLQDAHRALSFLVEKSSSLSTLTIVGTPLAWNGKLFNVAAVFGGGKLLGFVPKSNIPNYNEFYELRHFSPGPKEARLISFGGRDVLLGAQLLFQCEEEPAFRLAVEICEDLWVPVPPSASHAMAGATVIANLSASDEVIGKAAYRKSLVAGQSARLLCGYLYADAGLGESSTDMVFAGHDFICENGEVLSESPPFGDGWATTEIDLRALEYERRRLNTFSLNFGGSGYSLVPFSLDLHFSESKLPSLFPLLRRPVVPHPFVPKDEREKNARCEAILDMQVAGLAQRLERVHAQKALVGVSGGLDSCLALLVTVRTFVKLGRPATDAVAVTMPCFGTTDRTKSNALTLCEALGIPCHEIGITDSVRSHLRDVGASEETHDLVYENAQARVRTLTLMDLANRLGGIVVGTGDLSELALGWATYNGDHMSMYGVNSGVPKTLVRHVVKYVAEVSPDLREVLEDILATPVSPELLPPQGSDVGQRTESIVGPYELHDFFLYHVVRWGRPPSRVYALSKIAFGNAYSAEELLNWLKVFYRRFFAQQFKRSCLPDGPKIGSVSLSPRSDWRMPSDAAYSAWLRELEKLETLDVRGP